MASSNLVGERANRSEPVYRKNMRSGRYPDIVYICDSCKVELTSSQIVRNLPQIRYRTRKGQILDFCSLECRNKHTGHAGIKKKQDPGDKWLYKHCELVMYSEKPKEKEPVRKSENISFEEYIERAYRTTFQPEDYPD